ncbi:MAG: D-alanine-D-alanine ligase [Parcubacteria group bacterium GW2011_GWC1_35_8]|uniref:D-alanine--D-alanine ligase n=3 Tax=Candidatus Nomuraibacteriota TaxID=1752729 RepID=A0A1F6YWI1_9BACT|nr:MAG: D-alanine-D-alanine ligase [Parcubacteria group bacterium GW2011_GWC1_35_8]KKP89580.1 MAG: D-alanine-D-alanine ligase [Candidatus Nomurabacteria bacterium GW2011_GWC2_35_8]OGJ04754.1 MAG: D-alanine--D-alanine ligase A [Candidatus Nomurabacteria bacterium RIFOXYA2_FULL_35_9]OGJ06594.1 MAG: D-alanine--D-alanine ligase A [Candidatus Nomurabacteria bacterium RIFOXYA1_FULL_35_17]OGJ10744.1 MAG: D-alanine--D-alanine ligase A [Candidatus Nomurabacteria bacterium RIFOXYC2_FULL_36_19]OGJ13937.1
MAKKKLKIGVLFGGKSAEHDVSLLSAKNVINALDKTKYEITPIKIGRDGNFDFNLVKKFDVIFPVMHGPFGEDGSMQGLLKLAGVPFVGPSVLGSAVGMDKDVMKRLFRDAGIPIGKFITIRNNEKINFNEVKNKLGLPLFIKPANMGSSVGISKVRNEKDFKKAVTEAFKFDSKIVIEEFIDGREIECSVMGNENPIASTPGEIIANQDFYSYDAKYIDDGYVINIPAKISKETSKKVQELAVKVFKVLSCEGMGRVDFFLKENGEVIANEINTIPGFTNISMYPKLWEADGISQTILLDKLISFAIARFEREQKLKTTVK